MQSIVSAFLTQVTKHQWEITDSDDMMIQTLDWGGDEGIENMMGIYIQHPVKRFVEFFKLVPHLPSASAGYWCYQGKPVCESMQLSTSSRQQRR